MGEYSTQLAPHIWRNITLAWALHIVLRGNACEPYTWTTRTRQYGSARVPPASVTIAYPSLGTNTKAQRPRKREAAKYRENVD